MRTLWKHTPYRWSGGNSEQETAASLGFCTCFAIFPVTAAVFHFAYFTSTSTHVQCSRANRTPPLLVCESHDVHSKASSFPISWFSHVLGHCDGWFLHVLGHCSGQRSCVHLRMLHCTGQGVRSQRSKIGPKISQISLHIGQISWRFEIDRPKGLKEARRCRSVRKLLFPFAGARAKCARNGPSMHTHGGIRVRQTPRVCDSAARLDGLAKLNSRSNGLEGQTEPEIKRCGPTRVRN